MAAAHPQGTAAAALALAPLVLSAAVALGVHYMRGPSPSSGGPKAPAYDVAAAAEVTKESFDEVMALDGLAVVGIELDSKLIYLRAAGRTYVMALAMARSAVARDPRPPGLVFGESVDRDTIAAAAAAAAAAAGTTAATTTTTTTTTTTGTGTPRSRRQRRWCGRCNVTEGVQRRGHEGGRAELPRLDGAAGVRRCDQPGLAEPAHTGARNYTKLRVIAHETTRNRACTNQCNQCILELESRRHLAPPSATSRYSRPTN